MDELNRRPVIWRRTPQPPEPLPADFDFSCNVAFIGPPHSGKTATAQAASRALRAVPFIITRTEHANWHPVAVRSVLPAETVIMLHEVHALLRRRMEMTKLAADSHATVQSRPLALVIDPIETQAWPRQESAPESIRLLLRILRLGRFHGIVVYVTANSGDAIPDDLRPHFATVETAWPDRPPVFTPPETR